MKEIKRGNFKDFEALSETNDGLMIGGFTAVILSSSMAAYGPTNSGCTVTNNCNGGNCIKNCGATGGSGGTGG